MAKGVLVMGCEEFAAWAHTLENILDKWFKPNNLVPALVVDAAPEN